MLLLHPLVAHVARDQLLAFLGVWRFSPD